jgi:hypothetical protein
MQILHDLIGQLQAERDVIDERLRLAAELLNTYDPTEPDTWVDSRIHEALPEPPPEPTPKVKPKKQDAEHLPAVGAGDTLGVLHRSRKHPDSAAKPLRAVPAHRDPTDTFGEEFYACSSCNHEEPNLNGMKRHTLVEHGRPVNDTERKAIAA